MASPPWAVVKVQVTIYVKRLAFGDCNSGINNTYLTGSFQGANDALKGHFSPHPIRQLESGSYVVCEPGIPKGWGTRLQPEG